MTKQKEYTLEQVKDAEKLCQIKCDASITEWSLLRTIITAYIDGIGAGLQLSKQESVNYMQTKI